MRFHLGPVPEDEAFAPEAEGWTRLREPRTGLLFLSAIPLGMLMATGLSWLWLSVLPERSFGEAGTEFTIAVTLWQIGGFVLALVGFVVVHETLHALPVVLTGRSTDLVFGFWPRHMAPYAAFMGAQSRDMQLLSGGLPLIVLTVAPFVVATLVPSAAWPMAFLSVVNVLGSAADLVMLVLILRQVPRAAVIRNQGFSTWWRSAV